MNPLQIRRARVTVEVQRPDAQGLVQDQTYVFDEHRMSIAVTQGGAAMGNAKVQVYGVPLESMNQIARLWLEVLTPTGTDKLTIDVWNGSDFVPFFSGMITWSAVNAASMPNVSLDIEANDAGALMVQTSPPYAQEGPLNLRDILEAIAAPAGFTVDYSESIPELRLVRIRATGTVLQQITQILNAVPELSWYVSLQSIVVRPVNAPLGGDPVAMDKTTGMIGYPVYSTSGLTVATVFNPLIRPGVALDITTAFDFVNRTKWVAAVLQHNLQPNTPGGQWRTDIAAQSYGSKGDTSGSQT